MICGRCKRIMYPDGQRGKDNHKKSICCDGFPQNLKPPKPNEGDGSLSNAKPALWPQPAGVFVDGTKFDPFALLWSVRDMYHAVVAEDCDFSTAPMEYIALGQLLEDRVVQDGPRVLFRVYPQLELTRKDTAASFLETFDGTQCIRIECLEDDTPRAI